MEMRSRAKSIDEYIAEFPSETQTALREMRELIASIAPDAVETISYAIPTFDLLGAHLVHFAGYQRHVGFYPTGTGIEAFKDELTGYKTSTGAVQFPLGQPLPTELIRRIVEYRVASVTRDTAAAKRGRKPAAERVASTGKARPAASPVSQSASFLTKLAAPAQRALSLAGVISVQKLASFTESELLKLHGLGPGSIPVLRGALAEAGLSFREE